jgi:CSLREA domain-containing protein
MHKQQARPIIKTLRRLFLTAALLAGLALSILPVSHAADITVTTLDDENGTCATGNGCSLREAIAEATADQEIDFNVAGTIILTNGELTINKNLTITGPGADSLSISGNDSYRVFNIASSKAVTITGITIRDGKVSDDTGGGISNAGTLTLDNCIVSDNNAPNVGGIIISAGGTLTLANCTVSGNTATNNTGGIGNEGTLTLNNSTVYSNTATNNIGGIGNIGTLTLNNSTVSGNTASGNGGGIGNYEGMVNISNSTLYSNTATSGGGIYNDAGIVGVKNTIVANNTGDNCSGTITNNGYNIDSGTSCGWGSASGSMSNTDPKLDNLADNGGPTWTHALLLGSPAINEIPYQTNGCGTDYTTDQRGYDRPHPAGGSCDIGAFELYTVTIPVLTGWNLLSWPLLPPDITLDGVLGNQLHGTDSPLTADRVLAWDGDSQAYASCWYCGGPVCEAWGEPWANHWLANDYSQCSLTLPPDSGFWVQNRSGGTEALIVAGQVAEADRSVPVGENWQMLGSAFPDARPLDDANLPATGTDSPLTADRVLYWDADVQAYRSAWFCGGPVCEGWGEPWANHWLANDYSQTDIVLQPGHGFWYQNRHDSFIWLNPR